MSSRAALNLEASHPTLHVSHEEREGVRALVTEGEGEAQELSLGPWGGWGSAYPPWPALTVPLQVSGHLDYAKQMDAILKAVGIHTKPGWDEKGLLLAPGSLPQEEPRQAAALSSADKTTDQDGQSQGPAPGDPSRVPTSADPSQAQVPTGLDQSEGASLPTAACPAESLQTCSHGMDPNPLGCPSCASEVQRPCPKGLD